MASYRDTIIALANQALEDPAHAAGFSQAILEVLARWRLEEGGAAAPTNYLYAGAHTFIARERELEVELLPEEAPAFGAVTGVPITQTNNRPIDIKIPFDSFLFAVGGHAEPRIDTADLLLEVTQAKLASAAEDGRDLFSLEWGLDGQVTFMTDGHERLLFPAAACVGSRLVPRELAWTLRRNQVINVRFRNLLNAIRPRTSPEDVRPTLDAMIAFYVVNLEAP